MCTHVYLHITVSRYVCVSSHVCMTWLCVCAPLQYAPMLRSPEGRATSRYFRIFFRDSIDITSGTTIGQTGARRAGRRRPPPGRLGMAHLHSLRDLQMRNLVGDDLVILLPLRVTLRLQHIHNPRGNYEGRERGRERLREQIGEGGSERHWTSPLPFTTCEIRSTSKECESRVTFYAAH
jgi:hypothetical protein